MKKISIKRRIVFYYMASILLVLLGVILFILMIGSRLIVTDHVENLKNVTDRAWERIEFDKKSLVVDPDIAYSFDGAYVVLLKKNGSIVEGDLANSFTDIASLEDNQLQKAKYQGEEYFIFDRKIQKGSMVYWLRGVTTAEIAQMEPSVIDTLRIGLFILPLVLILIFIMGIAMTNRAFLPLRRITETAEKIQEEGDLSRRIDMDYDNGKDEIVHTAEVFDGMLEKIQENFQREKQFTDDAGHELRTPTAVIMAEAEYALQNLNDPEELKDSLESICQQSRKMSSLITTLLTFARSDRGDYEMRKEENDISLIAEECCDLLYTIAQEKEIQLKVEAEEGIYYRCDAVLIAQIFDNLVRNAIKYGNPGGWVRVKIDQLDGWIGITVSDNGIGIPEDEIPAIWGRFYRGSNGRAQTANLDGDQSMGLGLPLVRWAVDMHKGKIRCMSTLGNGTSFYILLPI